MEFWQGFFVLSILAAVFVLWPTIFVGKKQKKELRSNARTETNEEVFKQHYNELEQTRIRGEINAEELHGLKQDLEKTLIEENHGAQDESEKPVTSSFKSRIPVLVVVLALPILALVFYSYIGAKQDWLIYQLMNEKKRLSYEEGKEKRSQLILALQDRLKQKPNNGHNWHLLAATAVEQGQYEEGVRAFRQLLKLEPDSAFVKAELAQALFLGAGNTMTPEVRRFTQEALQIAPNMPTALGLAGIEAYQSGKYQLAIDYWQKALVQLDPNSSASQVLSGGVARAKVALSKTGTKSKTNKKGTDKASGLSLKVSVKVDKNKVQVNPTDTVFIYARAWQGPRMPLAIQKIKVSQLPITLTLDQSMSMAQGMDLSSFPQVEVVARISSSGSAISQSGDWQAAHGPVLVSSQKAPVKLTISEQIP